MAKLVVKEEDFQYWHTAQLPSKTNADASTSDGLVRHVIQYVTHNKTLGTGYRTQTIAPANKGDKNDLAVTSAYPGSKPRENMRLKYGGHGSSFGYDDTYFYFIWKEDSNDKNDLVRVEMQDGKVIKKSSIPESDYVIKSVGEYGTRVALDKTGTGLFLTTAGLAENGDLKFNVLQAKADKTAEKKASVEQSTLGISAKGDEIFQSAALAWPYMVVFTGGTDSDKPGKVKPSLYIYNFDTKQLTKSFAFGFNFKNIWNENNSQRNKHHEAETVDFIYPPKTKDEEKKDGSVLPMILIEFVNHSTTASDPVSSAKTHRMYVAQMHEEGKEPADMYYGKHLKQATRTYVAKSKMNVYKDVEFTIKTGASFAIGDSFDVTSSEAKTAAGTPRLKLANGSGYVSANVNFSSFNDIDENQA
ncbi:DUF5776 domain-containing protein [Lysinibacillus xylanilyticus]|uniref:DUF5776 domain-containing protein n=1 Tax=Lysinibacillus xylanilyticus TaxID=582475 RepID=UPI003802F507